jgi:hypothetical protein
LLFFFFVLGEMATRFFLLLYSVILVDGGEDSIRVHIYLLKRALSFFLRHTSQLAGAPGSAGNQRFLSFVFFFLEGWRDGDRYMV